MPLSWNVYGSKLLSCSLTAKVAGELRQCLFLATGGVKDQRNQNFVTSHSAKRPSKLLLQGAATRMSKRSRSQCSWEIMAAFKWTDELVDELTTLYEKLIYCISWWNAPSLSRWRIHSLVHKRLLRRLLRLLFIWIAMSRAQPETVSSIPSSVHGQFVI